MKIVGQILQILECLVHVQGFFYWANITSIYVLGRLIDVNTVKPLGYDWTMHYS